MTTENQSAAEGEATPLRLTDGQWVNIVNHAHCYRDMSKDDAVNLAVKLTEARMAANAKAAAHVQPKGTVGVSEADVRRKVARELRCSAFLHCDVNKEHVIACIESGKTLLETLGPQIGKQAQAPAPVAGERDAFVAWQVNAEVGSEWLAFKAGAAWARTQAPAVGAGWRPIETAPQDGRTLLLGYPNAGGKWRTVRGQWMSADYIADNWEDPDSGEPGWYETAVEAEDIPNCWPVRPTRWMPLPPAPECFSQPPVQGSQS